MSKMNHYDLVVVGGGTAGCAAAYTAGKLGLKTLLLEKNIHLGGTITSALVVPAMKSSDNLLNNDFYNELVNRLHELGGQVTYQGNPGWFNPELTKIVLDSMMIDAKVEVLYNTSVSNVIYENNIIKSLQISSNMLSECIGANYIVDATGNCEIGVLANCEFLENNNKYQPVSLRFEMAGIDLEEFADWILKYDTDRNVTTVEKIDGVIHLSTACTSSGKWALAPLFEEAVNEGLLEEEDRKYFQVFSIPGMPNSLSFNCPRVYFDTEINPLEASEASKALQKGRFSILRLSNFCKKYFPGFKNAYVSNIADALGIRVSRRIKGQYVYTVDDLKSGKRFDNPVLVGNYPIDVHSNKDGASVLEHINRDYYLPIESLISADYSNLYVAGRCLSADFLAQAALRIQPSCFSMGEGAAKHIADLIKK